MTEKTDIDLNMVELVGLAANILDTLFIKASKNEGKPIFKDIKQGKQYPLGSITIQNKIESRLYLELDYSEFCGPGFNFDAFVLALKGILSQVSQQFKMQGNLNLMSSDTGAVMIHLPGIIKIGEQINVMVLSFELGTLQEVGVKLMFIEPGQYDEFRVDKQETDSA